MFYSEIAKYYDYIFPQNKSQLDFIENISPIKNNEIILDVGAATGSLSGLLSLKSKNIFAIDLNNDLLNFAKLKYPNINFIYLDMLKIDTFFNNKKFDKIISFGNTIVHLNTKNNIYDFLKKSFKLLNDKGYLICQIINYDRILNNNISSLSTIENDKIKFIRNYIINNDIIKFNTILEIKEKNKIIENSIPLIPLKKHEIDNMLTKIGFKNINYYSNFKGDKFSFNSVSLIFSAQKI
ncbi:methyltransferase family protein [Hypnocyclicus thermotrophus]|uniref:Methyltransferase family protein n=1 Tax=Hypnocyclicus thermotrophus TaxID=1627895 RepID=A0AA46DZZ8_9FUSO|nr:class I SAM-dependent methyltransferase [Hypnocyclicus thermotrophus]TDT72247.1 methyltransferase family protein [Hypnocyclicus thermotrophus]